VSQIIKQIDTNGSRAGIDQPSKSLRMSVTTRARCIRTPSTKRGQGANKSTPVEYVAFHIRRKWLKFETPQL
jgi:hypothetical protein